MVATLCGIHETSGIDAVALVVVEPRSPQRSPLMRYVVRDWTRFTGLMMTSTSRPDRSACARDQEREANHEGRLGHVVIVEDPHCRAACPYENQVTVGVVTGSLWAMRYAAKARTNSSP